MNEPEGNEETSKKTDNPRTLIQWVKLVWDLLWDWKKLKPHIEGEIHHVKKFPLIILCTLVFATIGGWVFRGHFSNKTISYLSGQLNTTSNELVSAQIGLEKKTTDDANIIAQMQADHNEQSREKDAEIQKQTTEKDNALLRVSQLESLPQTAFLAYSNANAFIQAYTNANGFSEFMPQRMNLVPKINGQPFTNWVFGQYAFVPINRTNRDISISFDNLNETERPIRDLTVSLTLYINRTNIIAGINPGQWQIMNCSDDEKKPYTFLQIKSPSFVTPEVGYNVTTLKISTNYPGPEFQATIEVTAPDLYGSFHYGFGLVFDWPQH